MPEASTLGAAALVAVGFLILRLKAVGARRPTIAAR